ncbi:MAG: PDZ domain-containing protein, partial [Deltaproteobacteria bacterium]|nr:PDZ domain-containing protein [Deltaproteobacteria bacterium]
GRLSLAPQAAPQHLIIHYQKVVRSMAAGLISPQGIDLADAWYPQVTTASLFHLRAAIPADFVAVSEADSIETDSWPGGKTVSFNFSRPLDFLHFIAGPYVVHKKEFGAGKTLYTYFFKEDAALADSYLEKGLGYLQRYEKLIGPYPYQRFSIVENRLPTGYAMPTFTLLGQAVARLPFIVDTSLGHEILHSWFGNAIGVDYSQGNWCEGLTTYLADQAFAAQRHKGAQYRKGLLVKYASYVHDDLGGAVRDFIGGEARPNAARRAERAVGYGKTAMLFHMLRKKVGDEVFFAALRNFYQRMNGRHANWQDIEASFTAAGAGKLGGFFKQWLDRRDVPDIKAKKFSFSEVDGRMQLKFTLVQGTKKPYDLDVPIVIEQGGGNLRQVIHLDAKKKEVDISMDKYPRQLVIDPDYDLMRKLGDDEMPPVWSWYEGAAKKLVVVKSTDEHGIYAAYITSLRSEKAKITTPDKVSDKDLAAGALVFLGASDHVARGLFASPAYPASGLTVDVRKNPLNPGAPAVLIRAANQEELRAGLIKLRHYGKYSYLHFEQGHITAKRIARGEMGRRYGLLTEPTGVKVEQTLDLPKIINQLRDDRVIYAGESHTRYADHKLQLRLIRGLANRGVDLAIGMEMFPAAAQTALNDFVAGKIDEAAFLRQSKYFKVWGFDYRLYQEILNFARYRKIPVIGLNIDRDNVSKVYKDGGISALSPDEKAEIPLDRDLDVPGYRDRILRVYQMHAGHGHGNGFLQAQAIWDEVMAKNIVDYLTAHPAKHMVVIAGLGHVIKDQAIPLRVQRRIRVKQAVLVNSTGGGINPAIADYVIFSPEAALPPRVLMGIMMAVDKKAKSVGIASVAHHSPAARAGLQKGDTILTLDDKPVHSVADVKIIMLGKKHGDKLAVSIERHHMILPNEKIDIKMQL